MLFVHLWGTTIITSRAFSWMKTNMLLSTNDKLCRHPDHMTLWSSAGVAGCLDNAGWGTTWRLLFTLQNQGSILTGTDIALTVEMIWGWMEKNGEAKSYEFYRNTWDIYSHHDDVIKWEQLLALCEGNPPVTGRFPSQRSVTQSFDVFFSCAWVKGWANNWDASDFRRYRAHYEVTVMDSGLFDQWLDLYGCDLVGIILRSFLIKNFHMLTGFILHIIVLDLITDNSALI